MSSKLTLLPAFGPGYKLQSVQYKSRQHSSISGNGEGVGKDDCGGVTIATAGRAIAARMMMMTTRRGNDDGSSLKGNRFVDRCPDRGGLGGPDDWRGKSTNDLAPSSLFPYLARRSVDGSNKRGGSTAAEHQSSDDNRNGLGSMDLMPLAS
uniref:Uncharacterized protein n=1 Tax=Oryza punctata TaxID=4537 RepID=A0A0E0JWS3_ORYPU